MESEVDSDCMWNIVTPILMSHLQNILREDSSDDTKSIARSVSNLKSELGSTAITCTLVSLINSVKLDEVPSSITNVKLLNSEIKSQLTLMEFPALLFNIMESIDVSSYPGDFAYSISFIKLLDMNISERIQFLYACMRSGHPRLMAQSPEAFSSLVMSLGETDCSSCSFDSGSISEICSFLLTNVDMFGGIDHAFTLASILNPLAKNAVPRSSSSDLPLSLLYNAMNEPGKGSSIVDTAYVDNSNGSHDGSEKSNEESRNARNYSMTPFSSVVESTAPSASTRDDSRVSSIPDMLGDIGYVCSVNSEVLSYLLTNGHKEKECQLNESDVSKIISLIVCRNITSDIDSQIAVLQNVLRGSSIKLPEEILMCTWELNVVVYVLNSLLPSLNWTTVYQLLDSPSFVLSSQTSFNHLASMFKMATKSQIPESVFTQKWTNSRGLFSMVKYGMEAPSDLFSFTSFRRQSNWSVDWITHPEFSCCRSLNLIEILIVLTESNAGDSARSVWRTIVNSIPLQLLRSLSECICANADLLIHLTCDVIRVVMLNFILPRNDPLYPTKPLISDAQREKMEGDARNLLRETLGRPPVVLVMLDKYRELIRYTIEFAKVLDIIPMIQEPSLVLALLKAILEVNDLALCFEMLSNVLGRSPALSELCLSLLESLVSSNDPQVPPLLVLLLIWLTDRDYGTGPAELKMGERLESVRTRIDSRSCMEYEEKFIRLSMGKLSVVQPEHLANCIGMKCLSPFNLMKKVGLRAVETLLKSAGRNESKIRVLRGLLLQPSPLDQQMQMRVNECLVNMESPFYHLDDRAVTQLVLKWAEHGLNTSEIEQLSTHLKSDLIVDAIAKRMNNCVISCELSMKDLVLKNFCDDLHKLNSEMFYDVITRRAAEIAMNIFHSSQPDMVNQNMLMGLGGWLGILTIARNRPLLTCLIRLDQFIRKGFISFVCEVLKSCKTSLVIRAPNQPWVRKMLILLRDNAGMDPSFIALCDYLSVDMRSLPTLPDLGPPMMLMGHPQGMKMQYAGGMNPPMRLPSGQLTSGQMPLGSMAPGQGAVAGPYGRMQGLGMNPPVELLWSKLIDIYNQTRDLNDQADDFAVRRNAWEVFQKTIDLSKSPMTPFLRNRIYQFVHNIHLSLDSAISHASNTGSEPFWIVSLVNRMLRIHIPCPQQVGFVKVQSNDVFVDDFTKICLTFPQSLPDIILSAISPYPQQPGPTNLLFLHQFLTICSRMTNMNVIDLIHQMLKSFPSLDPSESYVQLIIMLFVHKWISLSHLDMLIAEKMMNDIATGRPTNVQFFRNFLENSVYWKGITSLDNFQSSLKCLSDLLLRKELSPALAQVSSDFRLYTNSLNVKFAYYSSLRDQSIVLTELLDQWSCISNSVKNDRNSVTLYIQQLLKMFRGEDLLLALRYMLVLAIDRDSKHHADSGYVHPLSMTTNTDDSSSAIKSSSSSSATVSTTTTAITPSTGTSVTPTSPSIVSSSAPSARSIQSPVATPPVVTGSLNAQPASSSSAAATSSTPTIPSVTGSGSTNRQGNASDDVSVNEKVSGSPGVLSFKMTDAWVDLVFILCGLWRTNNFCSGFFIPLLNMISNALTQSHAEQLSNASLSSHLSGPSTTTTPGIAALSENDLSKKRNLAPSVSDSPYYHYHRIIHSLFVDVIVKYELVSKQDCMSPKSTTQIDSHAVPESLPNKKVPTSSSGSSSTQQTATPSLTPAPSSVSLSASSITSSGTSSGASSGASDPTNSSMTSPTTTQGGVRHASHSCEGHEVLCSYILFLEQIRPSILPGFMFSWLQLITSPQLCYYVYTSNCEVVWECYKDLLVVCVNVFEWLISAHDFVPPTIQCILEQLLSLFMYLFIHYPDFLSMYYMDFLIVIPCLPHYDRLRAIIQSAIPSSHQHAFSHLYHNESPHAYPITRYLLSGPPVPSVPSLLSRNSQFISPSPHSPMDMSMGLITSPPPPPPPPPPAPPLSQSSKGLQSSTSLSRLADPSHSPTVETVESSIIGSMNYGSEVSSEITIESDGVKKTTNDPSVYLMYSGSEPFPLDIPESEVRTDLSKYVSAEFTEMLGKSVDQWVLSQPLNNQSNRELCVLVHRLVKLMAQSLKTNDNEVMSKCYDFCSRIDNKAYKSFVSCLLDHARYATLETEAVARMLLYRMRSSPESMRNFVAGRYPSFPKPWGVLYILGKFSGSG